jgi:hypothetical protein
MDGMILHQAQSKTYGTIMLCLERAWRTRFANCSIESWDASNATEWQHEGIVIKSKSLEK